MEIERGVDAALHFIRRETKNRYYGRDLDNAIESLFNAVRDHIDPALNTARETQEDLLFSV